MVAKLSLESKELERLLDKVEKHLGGDVRPIWREFAQYMRVVTDNTFKRLRHGGTYRGVHWAYFAPQYTRKTDGVTVPAWGGVPKIVGTGTVKGRLRPSGARVSAGDSVVQDSGVLRSRAALVVHEGKQLLRLMPQGVSYAKYQNRRRPFLFFTPKDAEQLIKIAVGKLRTL
jgi:hypothetical protein